MFRNRYGRHGGRVHGLRAAFAGWVVGGRHGVVVLTHAQAGLVVILRLVGGWGGVRWFTKMN